MTVWTDAQFDPLSLLPPLSAPLVPPPNELDVLLEMLSSLGTLTQPGQCQTMLRIVEIIRNHVPPARANVTHSHRLLLDLIAHMEHECERRWPDVDTFRNVAESAILLLKATA